MLGAPWKSFFNPLSKYCRLRYRMGSSSKNCVNAYTTLFSTPWKR